MLFSFALWFGDVQRAASEFLGSGGYDQHLRHIRRIFAGNIERMTRAIDGYFPSGTRVSRRLRALA